MAIDRSVNPAPLGLEYEDTPSPPPAEDTPYEYGPDVEVGIDIDEDEFAAAEDTSAAFSDLLASTEFDANLAEYMEDDDLHRLASDLTQYIDVDITARADWEDAYKEGIKLLGVKEEKVSEPWDGACSLTHPMLTEAVVRFQSETIMETFPAAGPVKTNIVGVETPEKAEAAKRVREDMNYQIVDVMAEYRPEHEKMLWNLPLAGSAFKKVYFDPTLGRQVSMFVPAEDIILPYGASDLYVTCPRITHRMKKTEEEIKKLQKAEFYKAVELSGPSHEIDDIKEAKDTETGHSGVQDDRYTLLEIHTELDLAEYIDPNNKDREEDVKPYVVTVERSSNLVLAIRRNWFEEDTLCLPRQHFVHYQYVPGFGAYGFGLIHLIGNYVRGATAFLRQLGDAGTLSNLPGGLKTKGLRIKNENQPISPGEFRDVDVVSGVLRDNIVPLPYKEPSQVLAQLLASIVDDGRRLAATADLKISDMSAQAPVGTTLAILERMLKVMSAIQARIHYSMKQELRLLAGIIRDYAPDEYSYDVEAPQGRRARKTDYEMVEIIPVSDPNAATMSQKIVQYQAVMQLAAGAPQIYNQQELHRQMLDVIGIKNIGKLIPVPEDMKPADPVSENMAILTGKPVKAFIHQDHDAHLTVHMSASEDPLLRQKLGQNPKAQEMQGAFFAHISDHLAHKYRADIEQMMGTQLPPPDQPLPPEVEVQLSRLVAQAAQKLLGKNTVQAQAEAAQQAAQDPVLQNEMRDLSNKEMDIKRKVLKDLADTVLKMETLELKREELDNTQVVKGMDAGVRMKKADSDSNIGKARLVADTMFKRAQLAAQDRQAAQAKSSPKPREGKK